MQDFQVYIILYKYNNNLGIYIEQFSWLDGSVHHTYIIAFNILQQN